LADSCLAPQEIWARSAWTRVFDSHSTRCDRAPCGLALSKKVEHPVRRGRGLGYLFPQSGNGGISAGACQRSQSWRRMCIPKLRGDLQYFVAPSRRPFAFRPYSARVRWLCADERHIADERFSTMSAELVWWKPHIWARRRFDFGHGKRCGRVHVVSLVRRRLGRDHVIGRRAGDRDSFVPYRRQP
jgi:hypothetical protein